MSYTVIVCDMFHFADDPEHEIEVPGFPTREAAMEYARRRCRRSLEALREPNQSPADLRSMWYTFGEDCRVVGPEGVIYRASAELAHFIRNPATAEECDYLSLYESLLPDDFALTCEWAAGAIPPPHHYEYLITVHSYEPTPAAPETSPGLYSRLQGEITFWPDYPAPNVPGWRETFPVWTQQGLYVYALLQDRGLLGDEALPQEAAMTVGSETVTLEVTAQGRTWRIRSIALPPEQQTFLLETVMPAVRALVPGRVWDRLELSRQAYHQDQEAR